MKDGPFFLDGLRVYDTLQIKIKSINFNFEKQKYYSINLNSPESGILDMLYGLYIKKLMFKNVFLVGQELLT